MFAGSDFWIVISFIVICIDWCIFYKKTIRYAIFTYLEIFLFMCSKHLFQFVTSFVAIFFGVFTKLQKATISFIMSVHPSINSAPTGRNWSIFKKSVKKFISLKCDNNNGTSHEDWYTFMKISCWIICRMRNVSYKSYRENQNTCLMFHNFFPKNFVIYEVMWKSMVEPDKPQMTI